MKSKFMVMVGGCACFCVAVATLPVIAEDIYSAISGSTRCDDQDEVGNCLVLVGHGVSKPLKRNGKKFNKQGNTFVARDSNTFIIPDFEDPDTFCWIDNQPGYLLIYDYSSVVATTPNGDLQNLELDDTKISSVCTSQDLSKYKATVHHKFIGGSGQYEGACGWERLELTGVFLPPDTSFSSLVGTQVGEIFVGDDCP